MFADRTHQAVGGAGVEAFTVVAQQDRSLAAFVDRQVDGASRASHRSSLERLTVQAQVGLRWADGRDWRGVPRLVVPHRRTGDRTGTVVGGPSFSAATSAVVA